MFELVVFQDVEKLYVTNIVFQNMKHCASDVVEHDDMEYYEDDAHDVIEKV